MMNTDVVATFLLRGIKLIILFDLKYEDKYLGIRMLIIVKFIMFKY